MHSLTPASSGGAFSHLVEAAAALELLKTNDQDAAKGTSPSVSDADVAPLKRKKKTKQASALPKKKNANKTVFPERLMTILNDESLTDTITWLPHGRSFVVLRPDLFMEKVVPVYLPTDDAKAGTTKYASFTRKLNRWGFRQATRGPDAGAFTHQLFRKDQPELCREMVCQRQARPERANATGRTKKGGRKPDITSMDTEPRKAGSAIASVSDDGSDSVHGSESGVDPSYKHPIPQGITHDRTFADKVQQQRDEAERLRVAKTMLYANFMYALNHANVHQG